MIDWSKIGVGPYKYTGLDNETKYVKVVDGEVVNITEEELEELKEENNE